MRSFEQAAGRLIVALDFPDAERARKLLKALEGIPCYMKVGLQLFYAAGPDFIRELKQAGYSVFLDVKMHDIPNTVKGGANSVTKLGADMFNVHAAGGVNMMKAAREGALAALETDASLAMPQIIAVTQLTSTNQDMLNREIGISGTVEASVVHYAALAREAGLDGVVASPLEVPAVKERCGQAFLTVTPGIRPAGSKADDQSRTLTPGEAMSQGTDYIVVGRPIAAAPNPREAAEKIIEEMM
ncbi:orotidine-5'-phosphate decarboxylase [Paenibacillus macerans]|uniref:orotidine-5'-phosphate decarboxylase n=1 Tax=Paenibacillus macerans TaxID=44252 RepID=UPI002041F5A2|nr:orotidine-5'-phosphate decarboxylase [Paenibacillus macerans]MCM3698462.1 orotidine-5'-phosphate decarboxylase [Paenibacillus macerans]